MINRISEEEINKKSVNELKILCFNMLYNHNGEFEEVLNEVLRIVGLYFGVSRVYIFENYNNDLFCKNTYEWCAEGISAEKQNLQEISYKDDLGGTWYDNFDEDGVFYCRNILDLPSEHIKILIPQGIISMLQCFIKVENKVVGYIGFDDCNGKNKWNKEKIETLKLISRLVSTYLIKEREDKKIKQSLELIEGLLENTEDLLFLINKKSEKLSYLNGRGKEYYYNDYFIEECYQVYKSKKNTKHLSILDYKEKSGGIIRILVKNDERQLVAQIEVVELKWETNEVLSFTISNVTEIYEINEKLIRTIDIAKKANSKKEDYLVKMNYEFRVPMNAIVGITDLILSGEAKKEDYEKDLSIIIDAANNLIELINASIVEISDDEELVKENEAYGGVKSINVLRKSKELERLEDSERAKELAKNEILIKQIEEINK